jgi:hypothetical protein
LPERHQFLQRVCAVEISDSTISRVLRRMGFSRKRSVGASERDEWLRAAWRVLVAGSLEAGRLVFLRTRWAPTPRWHHYCTLGRDEGSERLRARRATGGRERYLW